MVIAGPPGPPSDGPGTARGGHVAPLAPGASPAGDASRRPARDRVKNSKVRRPIGSFQESASARVERFAGSRCCLRWPNGATHRADDSDLRESGGVNGTDERATESRRARLDSVHKWAATLAAVVALAFSSYNFAELQQKPRIDVDLPHLLRTGPVDNGTVFQIQPTVSTRFKTQDVEVIRDAHLQLTPVGSISSSKMPIFYWHETGAYVYDFTSDQVNYHWSGDPAPFIVSQDKPQQPTLNFWVDNWTFQPGRYEGTLELSRSGNRIPLIKKFCLLLSKKAVDEIHGAGQRQIFFFATIYPSSTPPANLQAATGGKQIKNSYRPVAFRAH